MKTNKLLYILPLAALTACDPEFDEVSFDGGSADFTTTVAVGNSLTAGFQSNALRRDKQENSFPAMLAGQLKKVGGGEFKQPLLADGVGIGSTLNAEFGISLKADCQGTVGPSPGPITAVGQTDQFTDITTYVGANGPFNNVGVPGAKSYHLVTPGYGNPMNVPLQRANPYYARFVDLSNPDETLLAAAVRANPTFFTLWIGNNDVLSYATSGGSGTDQTGNPNPASYGSNDITDPTAFAGIYSQLISGLTANGAKGAVANIPDITSIPFFTTVKWNALALTQDLANQLNAGFAAYNAGVDANRAGGAFSQYEADKRKISFSAGSNPLVIFDASLTPLRDAMGMVQPGSQLRQLKKGELLTLTTPGDSIRCAGYGSVNPRTLMPNPVTPEFVLDSAELASLSTTIAAYNITIKSLADMNGLAFVDANARLKELATTGITESGIAFSSAFITGGAFSLDGVHPATRGYAIIANDFIDAINSKYGAKVPKVDVASFDTYEIVQ